MNRSGSWFLVRHVVFPSKDHLERRHRNMGAALLVALVMVPLVVSMLFMDGMIAAMTNKFVLLQDGHIQADGFLEPQRVLPEDRIASIDQTVVGYGIAYSRQDTTEVRIKGVRPSYFNTSRLEQLRIEGSFEDSAASTLINVMVSAAMAEDLGVSIGDRVAMMVVPESGSTVARPLLVSVGAIYDSGYRQLDSNLMFMPLESALGLQGTAFTQRTEFLLAQEHAEDLTQVLATLKERYPSSVRFRTWESFNLSVYRNFTTSRHIILVVFMMIAFVAAAYVASIASEMVQDNHVTIAVLKALGAQSRHIHQAFLLAVGILMVAGLTCGTTIGLFIGTRLGRILTLLAEADLPALRYYVLEFPLKTSWNTLLSVLGVLTLVSFFSVLMALRRIKRISPLELLQQE